MKTLAQILLLIFFELFFVVFILSTSLKFQILNFNFWSKSLQGHNVYQSISDVVKSSIDNQVIKQGGDKKDIVMVTDWITPVNTKDILNTNLKNLLNFLNGLNKELLVYIPFSKIPKGLIPKSLEGLDDEIPVSVLANTFNISGIDSGVINSYSGIGRAVSYVWGVSLALLLIFWAILITLTRKSNRFVSPGLALILSGLICVILSETGKNFRQIIAQGSVGGQNLNTVLISTAIPPLLTDIAYTWMITGIILAVVGLGLILIKKPR